MIKGNYFDEFGNMYIVTNVDFFFGELKDKPMILTYMNTIHFHQLIIEDMGSCVQLGLIKNVDEDYNAKLTLNSIDCMKLEIIERFGEDYHEGVLKKLKVKIKKALEKFKNL